MSSNKQEKKFKEVFLKADRNGDGNVSPGELKVLVTREFGSDISDKEIAEMFVDFDKDGDKSITWDEFREAMMKKPRRDAFEKMFRDMDKDRSNTLTREEVSTIMKQAGIQDNEIAAMFAKVDSNKDGIISFEEFMAMV